MDSSIGLQLSTFKYVQLDSSHTIARQGGEKIGYQPRKRAKTTNLLFLTDCQGIPLAYSSPIAGNHHDCSDKPHVRQLKVYKRRFFRWH